MKPGIKHKILLVLAAVLALSTTLDALLASYYTRQQNQDAAFAELGRDLLAWQHEMQASSAKLGQVAAAAVGDLILLRQLAELEAYRFQFEAAAATGPAREQARTLGYGKAVSLNRLALVLRTGGFSSIAVYSRGQLSHYVSEHAAGMAVPRGQAGPVWLWAPTGADGNLPTRDWPAWAEGRLPAELAELAGPAPKVGATSVTLRLLAPDAGALEVAVPVQGVIEDYPAESDTLEQRVVSELAIGGAGRARDSHAHDSHAGGHPTTFATVVLRKRLDQAYLRALARQTGNWPAIYWPDGGQLQQLPEASLAPQDWAIEALPAGAAPAVSLRSVDSARGPYYVALLPWRPVGQPRLVLGMAASRAGSMDNVRQTVTGILTAASLTLALSMGLGIFWLGRSINPILRLTAAVKGIGGGRLAEQAEQAGAGAGAAGYLRPLTVEARDEVGELAAAFNVMIAAHRDAVETLELRVQGRTAELRQQTRYLRALIDTLPLLVWIKDAEGNFLAVNQATATACGRASEQMVGHSDLDFWPRALALRYRADDAEVMASGRPKTVEEALAARDGTIWIETFKAPVLDEDGTVLGTVGAARDVSGRKAAEAARDAALDQANRLARLRSEFIAQMSHELRTPLNAILGYAQILRRERQLSERQAAGLATIQASGEHLLALINDVLDLSRIESEKLELNLADTSLPHFLQVVSDIIRVKAEEKQVLFDYQGVALPASVRLDPKRLRQVLLNLLGNAVKFTDRGTVSLRVSGAPGAADAAPGAAVTLRFEVRDSGIGMDEQQLARLFQPFEQVSAPERREGGAGLGLVISRQLVRLMGADIAVESVPGEGSLFWFELTLPCGAARAAPAPAPLDASGYAGRRRCVLVVDDMAQNRAMLVDLLTLLGFDTLQAANGLEALGLATRSEPELIVMDLMMPVMNGLEATRQIRLLPGPLAAIPIIIVSASASRAEQADSLAAGASAFLAKPIEQEILLQSIGAQLGLQWLYTPAAAPAGAAEEDESVLPPRAELAELQRLALAGNMRKIRERADYLRRLDPRYGWLAGKLQGLAENYQSKALLALVERYLAEQDG